MKDIQGIEFKVGQRVAVSGQKGHWLGRLIGIKTGSRQNWYLLRAEELEHNSPDSAKYYYEKGMSMNTTYKVRREATGKTTYLVGDARLLVIQEKDAKTSV